MRCLIHCVLLLPCCGCSFVNHQAPLTLGGRWNDQISQEPIATKEDPIVVRAQSVANETQRTLASTLTFAELLFVRAPVFVATAAVLRPFGMHPEPTIAKAPRSKLMLTSRSPDGQFYLNVRSRELEPEARQSTIELRFRIIRSGEPHILMEQTFQVADEVTFEKATAVWNVEKSVVTVAADNGREFRLCYLSAIDPDTPN